MSSFTALVAVVVTLSGINAVRIKQLDIPNVVRNGTGPVSLVCIYELDDRESGLVVKWFHNENEFIYQWIPPMAPQDLGVIHGRAEYPDEVLSNPQSKSIIQLREVTIDLGGNYTCSVMTYQSEDRKTGEMIVYAPENSLEISTTLYNQTHVALTCVVQGAWPQPDFRYTVDGVAVKGEIIWPGELSYRDGGFWNRYKAIVKEPETPVLVECEINIPWTGYIHRKGMVYYPHEFLRAEAALQRNSSSTINFRIVVTLLALLAVFKS